MLTFVEFLEEIARSNQTITVPPEEVNRLARRFGDRVREMGQWNTSDGTLEIPVSAVVEGVRQAGSQTLAEAVHELKAKPEEFVQMLESSSAAILIEKISEVNRKRFQDLMTGLQHSNDPAEIKKLKEEIDVAIFGR